MLWRLAFSLMNTASTYALALTESMGVMVNANVTCVKAVSAGDGLLACVTIFDRSNRMVSLRSEALVKKGCCRAWIFFVLIVKRLKVNDPAY